MNINFGSVDRYVSVNNNSGNEISFGNNNPLFELLDRYLYSYYRQYGGFWLGIEIVVVIISIIFAIIYMVMIWLLNCYQKSSQMWSFYSKLLIFYNFCFHIS